MGVRAKIQLISIIVQDKTNQDCHLLIQSNLLKNHKFKMYIILLKIGLICKITFI